MKLKQDNLVLGKRNKASFLGIFVLSTMGQDLWDNGKIQIFDRRIHAVSVCVYGFRQALFLVLFQPVYGQIDEFCQSAKNVEDEYNKNKTEQIMKGMYGHVSSQW